MENILSISQEGKESIIKIGNTPLFSKIISIYAGLLSIIFIGIVIFIFAQIPRFFQILIPIMLLLIFLITIKTASQMKHMALIFSKTGNKLNIKKIFSKNKSAEKTITLSKNAKLILVKFPISITYYQLFLKNNKQLESLIPVEWDVVSKFPFIHPRMKKFLYTPNNAKELSKLLSIPLEVSSKDFHKYLTDFKQN